MFRYWMLHLLQHLISFHVTQKSSRQTEGWHEMENTWHVHFDVFVVIDVVAVVVIGNTIEQCCQQLNWIKTFVFLFSFFLVFVIVLYSQFYYFKLGHSVMYVCMYVCSLSTASQSVGQLFSSCSIHIQFHLSLH